MSIVEETRKALLELVPEEFAPEEEAPEAEAAEGDDGEKKKAEKKPPVMLRGVAVTDYAATGVHLDVLAGPEQVVDVAKLLWDRGFFLEAVTGVDWIKEEEMEVIHDYNITDGRFCRITVRARIPRAEPEFPSISDIHPGANWHERETHDFFGIKFQGHPYLVPLLLPEDADFHPLLKDFTP